MQPIRQMAETLESLADEEHYLFALRDLSAAVPGKSPTAMKAMVGRAEKSGLLKRVCKGLYLYPRVDYPRGLVLFHAAARLRAGEFNYISLETALSDAGVISQVPMNWITLMSTGRSYVFNCGTWGRIEFIHTKRTPNSLASQVSYDQRCRLWRASVQLALTDMVLARRSTDLVDWEVAGELV